MKRPLLFGALIVVVVATAVKAFLNDMGRDKIEAGRGVVSQSAREAESQGVHVATLHGPSGEIVVGTRKIVILEAWIERYAVRRYPLVWFQRRVPAGGFILALRPTAFDDVHLWLDRDKASFVETGGPGREIYFYHLQEMPSFPLTLFAKSGRDTTAVILNLKVGSGSSSAH